MREPLAAARAATAALAPGEAVDRLVVVADRAELVALAEPELEQRLLEQVHVLVLVDRERAPALAHERERGVVVLEHADRALEQILEVERARLFLAPLVLAEDAMREVGRDRRLVPFEPAEVRLAASAGGSSPTRPRWRDRPPDGTCTAAAAGCRSAGAAGPSSRGCAPGRRAKRRSSASAAEWNVDARTPSTPSAASRARSSPGRLVGERDRDDVRRRERAARDLPGDPPRDRRRLAGARAREDADRPVRRLDGGTLLVVQIRRRSARHPRIAHRTRAVGRLRYERVQNPAMDAEPVPKRHPLRLAGLVAGGRDQQYAAVAVAVLHSSYC